MSVAAVASKTVYGQVPFGAASYNDEQSLGVQARLASLLNATDTTRGATTAGTAVPVLGGHGLAGSVMLAFARLGYTLPSNTVHFAHTASANAATPASTAGADSFTVAKDMRAFLQALFEAVNGGASSGAANQAANSAAAGGNPQSGLAGSLQSLAQGLNAGSSGLSAYDQLQAAYQKLLSDMPSGPAGANAGTATDLQSFLQTLSSTVSTDGSSTLGSLVDALA
ncbi:MAG: hypothetical protein JO218_08190 [Burkholderiales bacterium]|nr:hypothetical protein [Burkholderiales bacterium]